MARGIMASGGAIVREIRRVRTDNPWAEAAGLPEVELVGDGGLRFAAGYHQTLGGFWRAWRSGVNIGPIRTEAEARAYALDGVEPDTTWASRRREEGQP